MSASHDSWDASTGPVKQSTLAGSANLNPVENDPAAENDDKGA